MLPLSPWVKPTSTPCLPPFALLCCLPVLGILQSGALIPSVRASQAPALKASCILDQHNYEVSSALAYAEAW